MMKVRQICVRDEQSGHQNCIFFLFTEFLFLSFYFTVVLSLNFTIRYFHYTFGYFCSNFNITKQTYSKFLGEPAYYEACGGGGGGDLGGGGCHSFSFCAICLYQP